MDRRFIKPSVRRCLFGRPTNNDDFVQAQKRLEEQEAEQFKRRWNLDGLENDIEWTKADTADIPEFYSKAYSHKCRRRAVRPCIGKTLSFADDHEDSRLMDDVSVQPVQYCTASSVEVFIGLLQHQPPQEPRTPTKNDSGHGDPQTPKSENSDSSTTEVVSNFPSSLKKNSTQTRLTDMWRVLKRRQRSLVPGQLHHKRARIGRLQGERDQPTAVLFIPAKGEICCCARELERGPGRWTEERKHTHTHTHAPVGPPPSTPQSRNPPHVKTASKDNLCVCVKD